MNTISLSSSCTACTDRQRGDNLNLYQAHIKVTILIHSKGLFYIDLSTSLGMIGMSEQSPPPQWVSFRENNSQQTNQKTVFTQIFIRNLGHLSNIIWYLQRWFWAWVNSRESGFARMLQSDVVIWFQRYRRNDLNCWSISLHGSSDWGGASRNDWLIGSMGFPTTSLRKGFPAALCRDLVKYCQLTRWVKPPDFAT
jgi:hypothetical protein